jgi:integrase
MDSAYVAVVAMTDASGTNPRPAWWDDAMHWARVSLTASRLKRATAYSYAGYLGVPRDLLRTWQQEEGPTASSSGAVTPDAGPEQPGRPRRSPTVQPFFQWCEANGVDPLAPSDVNPIERWLNAIVDAGAGRDVQKRGLAAVHGWYTTAAQAIAIPPRVRPVPVTAIDNEPASNRDTVQAMRLAARRDRSVFHQRDQLIIDLLAIGGLRAAEIVRLNVNDIVRAESSDRRYQLDIAGSRRIILPNALGEQLAAFADLRREVLHAAGHDDPGAEPLFLGRYNRRLTTSAVAVLPRRVARLPKLDATDPDERGAARVLESVKDTITPAGLRDFAQATARAHGVPADAVRSWLGLAAAEHVGDAPAATGPPPSVVVANALLSTDTD